VQVQILSGAPSTEGGSGGRARPISVLLAGSTPARCTKRLGRKALWAYKKGRAVMQPPFKRTYPGSTPGRPTFGLLAQLAEQPPLKRKCVGSNPAQPTKCPCDATGRHRLLKPSVLQVQVLPGVCGDGATVARKVHTLQISECNSHLRHRMLVWLNGRATVL
jgi:hypothetical protein